MVTYQCPCCGGTGNKPILFEFGRQKIFAYIWDNPNCTAQEIRDRVVRHGTPQSTTNAVRFIEGALERTTEFRLIRTLDYHKGRRGGAYHRFKIVRKASITNTATERPPNGAV